MQSSFTGIAFAMSFFLMLPSVSLSQPTVKAKVLAQAKVTPRATSAAPPATKAPSNKKLLPIPDEARVLSEIAGIASNPSLVAAVKEVSAAPPKADPSAWKTMKPKDPVMQRFLTNKIAMELTYKRTRWMVNMSVYGITGQVLGFTNKTPLVRSEKSPLMKGALQGNVIRQKGGNLFSAPIVDGSRPIGVLVVRVDPAKM